MKSFFSGDQNFKRFCADVCKYPLLSSEAELETVKNKNYELLINSNLRFVISIAHSRVQPNIELEDLVQAGCEGLIKAAYKYNVDYENVRFVNYAANWINYYINEYIRMSVNKSRKEYTLHREIKHYISNYESENGFVPPLEYIAEDLHITEERVIESLCRSEISIDSPLLNEEDSCTFGDTLVFEQEENVEETSFRVSKMEIILRSTLSETEIEFVHYRFGYMNGGCTMSLTSVANMMGISRQWADKLEKRVKSKLSNNMELKNLAA